MDRLYTAIHFWHYICSARLGNLAGCVTGFRLRNGISGYAIGRPNGIPESSLTCPVA